MRVARKLIFLIALVCILAGVAGLVMSAVKVLDPFAGSRQHAAQEQLSKSWAGQSGPLMRRSWRKAVRWLPRLCTGQVFAIIQIPASAETGSSR